MKLLTDHDVYSITVQFLRALGHDVATAREMGLSTSSDRNLLEAATAAGRIVVTRDRDYGTLVFSHSIDAGVLYLRLLPSTVLAVHAELERVLAHYRPEELSGSFVAIEPGRHRIRRVPGVTDGN